ncbi:MarR family winged helix-turn-helix transcriptional regulator [Gloeobacter kilaueensis]|uniref:MarR family transcriptional regulator n=1 Tax=Gloeobacter kilaueensis (strain ATCC BAA-2537 / CCAP 1431/1 / ULC 316 / JS1) TaxID=1183438 RepID=U5QJS3_GLOK1|nr:MarR family transcriptional regulator [Gloeobacter kilaueensis]AGY59143.1 MarR family transcriptional regulator [Gloeobacter kilaueensis JS1]
MGTRYRGSTEQVLALDVYIKLMRASDAVANRVHSHLKAVNLTVSQFGVLEALLHLGPLSQSQLAQKLLKSGGNMTLVIDNLQKRGLIERVRSNTDRRTISVHLTEAGRKLIERVFAPHVEQIVSALAVLSEAERHTLGQLCRKLGLAQKDNGNNQIF